MSAVVSCPSCRQSCYVVFVVLCLLCCDVMSGVCVCVCVSYERTMCNFFVRYTVVVE